MRSRRSNLRASIERDGGIWTAERAASVNAAGGWGPNRNTARKDLRALERAAFLRILPRTGSRSYVVRIVPHTDSRSAVLREDRDLQAVTHG